MGSDSQQLTTPFVAWEGRTNILPTMEIRGVIRIMVPYPQTKGNRRCYKIRKVCSSLEKCKEYPVA
jgi:hypothetical protein